MVYLESIQTTFSVFLTNASYSFLEIMYRTYSYLSVYLACTSLNNRSNTYKLTRSFEYESITSCMTFPSSRYGKYGSVLSSSNPRDWKQGRWRLMIIYFKLRWETRKGDWLSVTSSFMLSQLSDRLCLEHRVDRE